VSGAPLPPGCALHPARPHRLLLRAALLPRREAREAWWEWRAAADLDKLDLTSLQLLPRVFSNLAEELGDDGFDRWVRGIVRASWLKAQSLAAGARPLFAELVASGVPLLLVKGMAVVEYFPRGFADRPMIDLDVAVPRDHRAEAWRRLEAAGFRAQIDLAESSPLLEERGSWNFEDARGTNVDLHWRTLPVVLHPEAESIVWTASRPARFVGLEVRVPAPRHVLLQSILHASAWEPSPPVRWAADATLLLRGTPAEALDWPALVRETRALRLREPVRVALGWLAEEFAAPVPREALRALDGAPRWQRRELRGLLAVPSARSPAERRAIAFGQQLRRDWPPGAEPGRLARLDLAARRRELRGAWAVPLWGAFVVLGRPPALRPDAERLRLRPERPPLVELGRRLGFGHGQNAEPLLASGWEWGLEHGRWTRGAEARLELALPAGLDGRVGVEIGLIPYLAPDSTSRRVDVWANGVRVARWTFRGDALAEQARPCRFELPRKLVAGGRISLLLHLRDPYVPAHQHGHAREPRSFGVHVGWLELTAAPALADTGEIWHRG
jgi:hypothetical protein